MSIDSDISLLTNHQVRLIVKEVVKWCMDNISNNGTTPKVSVRNISRKRSMLFGYYCPNTKTIVVNRYFIWTLSKLIKVVIHEYTHHIQYLDNYGTLLKKLGYEKHPAEIEARHNEQYYINCYKSIF